MDWIHDRDFVVNYSIVSNYCVQTLMDKTTNTDDMNSYRKFSTGWFAR